ncbi:MAG: hypothetical protein R2715_10685 [Ilumatobacteraceae bacterium]
MTTLGEGHAPSAPLTADERAALQRRVLRVLQAGQIVGAVAMASATTVGAFVIQDLLGDETAWTGLATAAATVGAAAMSQSLARRMSRSGRRAGLQLGYATAATGALVAALATELRWFPLFLIGLFLYGSGSASNLMARYAASDLAEPEERASAMSKVVFATTFGAVWPMLADARRARWRAMVRARDLHRAVVAQRSAPRRGDGERRCLTVRSADRHRWAAPGARPVTAGADLRGGGHDPSTPGRDLGLGVDGDLPRSDGGRHGDDAGAHEAARPRDDEPVRGVVAHRRDVRSPLVGRFADRCGRLMTIQVGAILLVASTAMGRAVRRCRTAAVPGALGAGPGLELRADRRVEPARRRGAGEQPGLGPGTAISA